MLNAKHKGDVLTSQSMRNSLLRPWRQLLKHRAQDAHETNQRLEDIVLEVTETLEPGEIVDDEDVRVFSTVIRRPSAEGRPFADVAVADRPSTSSTGPSGSRQAQITSLSAPPAKYIKSEFSL